MQGWVEWSCGLIGITDPTAIGLTFVGYALTRSDPYPTFMTDYLLGGSRSYEEAKRPVSNFVVTTFPIGSDAKDAIAQITRVVSKSQGPARNPSSCSGSGTLARSACH